MSVPNEIAKKSAGVNIDKKAEPVIIVPPNSVEVTSMTTQEGKKLVSEHPIIPSKVDIPVLEISEDLKLICLQNITTLCHNSLQIFDNLFCKTVIPNPHNIPAYALLMFHVLVKSFEYKSVKVFNELQKSLHTFIIDVVKLITPKFYDDLDEIFKSWFLNEMVVNNINFLDASAKFNNFDLFKHLILAHDYDVTDTNHNWMAFASHEFIDKVRKDNEISKYLLISTVIRDEWCYDQLDYFFTQKYKREIRANNKRIFQKLDEIDNKLKTFNVSGATPMPTDIDLSKDFDVPVVMERCDSESE